MAARLWKVICYPGRGIVSIALSGTIVFSFANKVGEAGVRQNRAVMALQQITRIERLQPFVEMYASKTYIGLQVE